MILSIAIVGLVFGVMGLAAGLIAIIEVKAMQKSTHSVQYVPIEEPELDNSDEQTVPNLEDSRYDVDKEVKEILDQEDSMFFGE